MGCQQSTLTQLDLNQNHTETLTTEQDIELKPEILSINIEVILTKFVTFRRLYGEAGRQSEKFQIEQAGLRDKNTNLFSNFHEVEVLKKLIQPNIVQIVEYFSQPNILQIILGYVPGSTLHELYCRQEIRSLEVIMQIVKQKLIALKFCYEKGIIHQALNPEHVMIVQLMKSKSHVVKFLGFRRALKNDAHQQHKDIVKQDLIFNPPELGSQYLADKPIIWACGLISGQRKFEKNIERIRIIIQKVMSKQPMPQDEKAIITDFLKKMLSISPQNRPSAEQALDHEIFRLSHKKTIYVHQNNSLVINKLLKFRAILSFMYIQNNLKSLFFMYATLNILSIEEKSVYLRQFYNLDKNKDGKIDFNELVQGMHNSFQVDHETAAERICKIFELCNKQRGHFLQFHYYVAATTLVSKLIYQKKLVKFLNEIDSNKDRKITKDLLARAVEGVKSSHYQKISNIVRSLLANLKSFYYQSLNPKVKKYQMTVSAKTILMIGQSILIIISKTIHFFKKDIVILTFIYQYFFSLSTKNIYFPIVNPKKSIKINRAYQYYGRLLTQMMLYVIGYVWIDILE